jgi:hypothetical protein
MDEPPFAPKFFFGNLGHAVNFLFSLDQNQSGSLLLSVSGIVCTLFAFVFLVRRWRQTIVEPEQAAFFAVGLGIAANSVVVLFYFWGQLDDFMATRLALPLLLLFSLASAFVLGRWFKDRIRWFQGAVALLVAWFWLASLPYSAKATATHGFLSFQEVRDQMEFIQAHPGRVLFIIPRPLPALLQRRAAMTVGMLDERAAEMAHHLRLGTFDDVIVVQRLELRAGTHTFAPAEESRLGPEFVLETLQERQLQPLFKHRFSRLVAVDDSRIRPRPADWKPNFPPFQLPVPAGETPTAAYLREYFQKLP